MAKSVNGKTLQQCFKELSVYQTPDEYKQDKYPYYKIKTYMERINKVFGMEHYNVTYPTLTDVYKIRTNQEFITVKCHLEILDDDGNVILVRDGISSREITLNKDGKEVNLNNLYRSTSQLAFKAAWDHLNIFGKAYEEEYPEHATTKKNDNNNKENHHKPATKPEQNKPETSSAVTGNEVPTYCVMTKEQFSIQRYDSNQKPVYTVLGVCKDGQKCKIVLYPNQYKNCEDKINYYITQCKKGSVEIQFKASSSGIKEGYLQLIFKGFI